MPNNTAVPLTTITKWEEKLGKKEKFQPVHSNVSWLSWAPRTGHEAVMQHGLFACICWLKLLFVHFWCSSASLFCSCLCSLPSIQTLVFQSPSAPCLVVEPMLDPFQRERYLLQYSETFSLLKHGFWSYVHYRRIIESWNGWLEGTSQLPAPTLAQAAQGPCMAIGLSMDGAPQLSRPSADAFLRIFLISLIYLDGKSGLQPYFVQSPT